MSSTIGRQTKALLWRYIITLLRSYISSTLRIFVGPGLILGVIIYLMVHSDDISGDKNFKLPLAPLMEWVVLLVTALHLIHFTQFLILDRSTRFKSLMISMGLSKGTYCFTHTIASLGYLLPICIILSALSIIYVLDGTQAHGATVIIIFILFAIHLSAVAHVFASLITSSKFNSLLYLILVADIALGPGIKWLMRKVGQNSYAPIMFFASLSPYESIRIFFSGYNCCKNCDKVEFDTSLDAMNQPPYLIIIAMITWIVISYLLASWLEEVCPWKADSAVKNIFYCFGCQSKVRDLDDEDDCTRGSKHFERVSGRRDIGIRLYKLTKTFNKVPAVSDVTFNIFKGETTLLLGHNGAGKTTMMSMILGQLQQDYGVISIRHRGVEGRQSVGVCPQESILDENLSIKQHIRLFADIKSSEMNGPELDEHIKATIKDVSLTNHKNKLVSELSGGMKRKLSLALAFVARSNILILDEPSSGLDPDSRVFIWDAIRRYRSDRTVLLSTQHMEEADYLGDRIAIMSGGRILYCGSSNFLNRIYGSGYKLRIECHASRQQQVSNFVRRYFEAAHLSDQDQMASISLLNTNNDPIVNLVFELTEDKGKDPEWSLITMLEDIEVNSKALHIKSFGLKSSSIEDVLLNTSKSLEAGHRAVDFDSLNGNLDILNDQQRSTRSQAASYTSLLLALIVKHMNVYRHDWFSLIANRVVGGLIGCYSLVDCMFPSVFGLPKGSSLAVLLMYMHLIHYPALDQVSRFKTVQLMSNLTIEVYWLAYLLMDALLFPVLFVGAGYFIFEKSSDLVEVFAVDSAHVYTVTMFAIFFAGISVAILAYILSTVLSSSRTAIGYFIIVLGLYPLTSALLSVLNEILKKPPEITSILEALRILFVIVSPVESLQYITSSFAKECHIALKHSPCYPKDGHQIYIGFTILIGQIIVYGGLLLFIEHMNFDLAYYMRWRNWPCCWGRSKRGGPIQMNRDIAIDQDVIDESAKARALVSASYPISTTTYGTVTSDVSKSYIRGISAVNGLSFTVNKGECFGLLGVNGAGKSTTFSMLASESRPDSGTIWIDGNFSHEKLDGYRRYLGYDPQSNPDILLTPLEALSLMAKLRQLDNQHLERSVNAALDLLNMAEHSRKNCSKLSGGTKRKLGLAMSLIGVPSTLLLDEPTAGIDPIARRSIWLLLRALRSRSGTSVVISSHAMEECEAVCDRISIMAGGKLRCVGTFLRLRSKFSQGFTIRVQFTGELPSDRVKKLTSDLSQLLRSQVGDSVRLTDSNYNSATFGISDDAVRRSSVFKILREFRRKHEQVSYMLNDSSLEDIFIALAKEQQDLEQQMAPEQQV